MAANSQSHSPSLFHNPESPVRRRLSLRNPPPKMSLDSHDLCCDHDHEPSRSRHSGPGSESQDPQSESRSDSISISSNTKQVARTVRPFLAEHIPQQYNPLGNQPQPRRKMDASNTKYCYRHRPDLKCRRQANEPSMEQLQNELGTLSQSDQQGIAHVWSLFSAAPSKHRNLMLQGILAQCCFPQLSFVSAAVRDLIKIDFLSALPPELGFKILCYLDTTSLCKAAQVSQRWRTLADDDVVWHKMCEQHIDRKCTKCGWGLPLLEAKRLRTEKRQMQLRATGRGLNEWSPAITPLTMAPEIEAPSREASAGPSGVKRSVPAEQSSSEEPAKRPCTSSARTESESYFQPRTKRPWKDVYKDRFKVGTNWKYGRYSIRTIKGHNNGITCLQFDDHILATGSYDATVKIWDIETGKELRTLKGHTNGVRCLQFDGDLLFSGGLDRTVRMWNWKTGALMRTLQGHTGGIITLHKAGTMLATGSMDHKVRVWNFAQKQAFCLEGHTDWVNAVKIDIASKTLFSASDDCTIRLWDLNTKQCLKVYKGHVGQVQQVLAMPPEFELDNDDPDEHSDHDHDHIHSHSQTNLDHGHDHSHDFDDAASGTATPTIAPSRNHRSSSRATSTSHSSSANSAFNFGFAVSHAAPASPTSLPHFYPTEPSRPQPPRYIVTGALDGTIRLWCVASGRCLRTFFGHVEGVWALAADTLRIVSGAEDRMVKVWDPRTARCERTFTGHKGPVTCVGLSDSRLVSAGEDAEVRIMSFGGEGTEGGGSSSSAPASASTSAGATA